MCPLGEGGGVVDVVVMAGSSPSAVVVVVVVLVVTVGAPGSPGSIGHQARSSATQIGGAGWPDSSTGTQWSLRRPDADALGSRVLTRMERLWSLRDEAGMRTRDGNAVMFLGGEAPQTCGPVSYTHLTLPTTERV